MPVFAFERMAESPIEPISLVFIATNLNIIIMKKSFLTFVFLLALTALNAQTLIKAKFQKGEQATYSTVSETKISTPMGGGDQSLKTSM